MTHFPVALITGASSGLGRALAEACAGPGVTLHLCGRDAARLRETAASCQTRGAGVRWRVLDVRDAAEMASWIGAIGRLDLVVANAGISGGTGRGGQESTERTQAIFDVNVGGVLNTVQPAMAAMASQAPGADGWRGRIAVISSIVGFIAAPQAPAYCAAKAAADRWTVATAANARRDGVLISSVCPGYVRTNMTARNQFVMPGLMEPHQAAAIILRGVARGRSRMVFPWWLGLAARVVGAMPPRLLGALLATQPATVDR